jgi:hypothetical protein
MRALYPILAGFVGGVIADIYPFFQSKEFDLGEFGPYPNRTFFATPQHIAPKLNILQSNPRCQDGLYTMVSLRGESMTGQSKSPMILDNNGHLVWMNATYGETFALGVQTYKGEDYLTFWKGNPVVAGHGEGHYYMVSKKSRRDL